ncbi:EAL domain-containing protein [Pelotalea chapellei]|uniref:EAL domain-containing protein n=1 Tax=Pelotalea chapellei TaxID=44671 RepID=A0ABS5U954_9BACT|nr:EAL domain-containing protein [Pelotalea chapellei]MBT1072212.1 EAL domain-containing protein [Pelotalea chapellei]
MNLSAQAAYDSLVSTVCHPDRLLIVDDEARIRASLRLLLESPSRTIQECETGGDAITILKTRTIDLVLLDINLPDLSGLEVMEWIASYKIPTSVIIVSSDDHIDSAIRALRNGVVEFVRKPKELDEIQHKVENVLNRRSMERRHLIMTARLEQSERLHRFLVENSPDLIYTLDSNGCFLFINNRTETLLGYTRDELVGSSYTTIVHEDDLDEALYAFTERRSDNRAVSNVEVRLKCKGNHYRSFESRHVVAMLSATGVYDCREDGLEVPLTRCFMGTYGVARDITERKKAEETISFQALHDQLTHLPNRRLFMDRLELSLIHSQRYGRNVAVMFIDLDRFKLVNDTHGHAEGDGLLRKVAERLRKCVRSGDTLARQGGDEFTVLLPDIQHSEDAIIIAEKIQEELKLPFQVRNQEVRTTASIGIAVYPRDGAGADELLKHADIAMYKVKASGKNNFMFFNAHMNECYHERLALENELRQAIKEAEFELHYQPQISVIGNRIIGVEALIRWRHPVHGLLTPEHFISLAEETGLICEITDWVVTEACRQLALWRSMGLQDLRMSVNMSPQEVDRSDVVERMVSSISRYNIPPHFLEIEITENLMLRDVPQVIDKLKELHGHGIRISIDDFGTCYSSLNYLRQFPINSIKIDKSFVCDLREGSNTSPIIHAIIGIAKGFRLDLVVEGVETLYQMKILHDLGCDEMQGYFFSKPLPAADVECLLLNSSFLNDFCQQYHIPLQPSLPQVV